MKKIFVILGLFLAIFALYVTFFSPSSLPISPLGSPKPSGEGGSSTSPSYVILGFAPYWNLKKLTLDSLADITHFAYFHLLLRDDGSIYTKINRREEDPGYTNYKRLVAGTVNRGTKPLILTFMPESQSALADLLSSLSSRARAIATILTSLSESGSSGVNIDFEPLGETPPSLRDSFTLFVRELRSQLDLLPNNYNLKPLLTISTYASAAVKPRIWDLSGLAPLTDYFVVMAYDYTMPGSDTSGPTAPLRGSGELFEHDIIKNIAEITKLVPAGKLLLGIPFYGYQWDTQDSTKYSPVEAKGSVASLERIQQMLDDQTLSLLWDRNTLTPYGIASESGQISQIYFENETSIRLKLEFVKSAGLGGIAIWALGYEGNIPWLWPLINSLNN
ncbi:hypothetical protein COT87_01650 [Candidatus Collierbacteria bacterium CG10_big_fil_rev_8_21_14_0_10_44_9]|uniref:GH18 domain-containing protein n=1 Tax=Candidatus Collierbacteria bacterium CG10_big_fil_rev_8_21_14_0_10_44_9 TaxID=1974535 RepID=A0A2H0VIX5_9BACT|nr:MAG: hypothetical protein COT87_01650 [Candidatus Collierbacteria bacterium CG10_big_fil_rev_8_21_14_0_10_44_9]